MTQVSKKPYASYRRKPMEGGGEGGRKDGKGRDCAQQLYRPLRISELGQGGEIEERRGMK